MLENEKERGKALAHLPPSEASRLIRRMMFGKSAEQAQMAMFMLMGQWGVLPPGPPPGAEGPPGHAGGPPGSPPPPPSAQ